MVRMGMVGWDGKVGVVGAGGKGVVAGGRW